jgi:hypothetical protein
VIEGLSTFPLAVVVMFVTHLCTVPTAGFWAYAQFVIDGPAKTMP